MHSLRILIFYSFISLVAAAAICIPCFSEAEDSRYAALVIDADTGAVLHQENAGKTRYPASLTKIMTLYLAFQALDRGTITMDKRLNVSAHAASQKPSVIGLRPGQTISAQDAINAVIIKSANDAAAVLAEGLAGSEWQFAVLMNRTAKSLGMKNTNFANSSGLPDNRQVTTAYDLARLAVAVRRDYPQYYSMFSRASFTYNGHTYFSHNRVTKNYRGADGLKTGYIRASGFNLVTSAKRGGKSLVGVVMGGRSIKSRDTNMVKLLDQAFYKMASGNITGAQYLNTSAINSKENFIEENTRTGAPKNVSAQTLKPQFRSNIEKSKIVSQVTKQSEAFSRDVIVTGDDNVPTQKFKRDIFSPALAIAKNQEIDQVEKSANTEDDNIKPTRIKVRGKNIPLPTFRPTTQEKGIVTISPRGSMQESLTVV